MADNSRTIMTDTGFALEGRVRADETKMQFTRAAISTDDHFSESDDVLAKLTALEDVQQDGQITEVQVINDSIVHVQVDVNQAETKSDYEMRSAILYAKDDAGTEIAYGVVVLQDPVFVHKDDAGSYLGFGIDTKVGRAANVTVVVNPANMVTKQVFDTTMQNYYTKTEIDTKLKDLDEYAKLDSPNAFTKQQTLSAGAVDGNGNAYVTDVDAKATAQGLVDAGVVKAASDATTKANGAKTAGISAANSAASAAAVDATGKANSAEAGAETYASSVAAAELVAANKNTDTKTAATLVSAKAYADTQAADKVKVSDQLGGTNLLKNGKFDQGMNNWHSWGTSTGATVDFRTGDKDWDGRATTLIHIKKPNPEGQFGVAQDGVLVSPHTQYVLSAVRTGPGPIYLQNGNGSTDPYQDTISQIAGAGAVATHTFTTGDTRTTNAYVGFGDGDTGEILVSLVKLEKGATHSDWSPYVPSDVDDSATVRGVLADTDDVHNLTVGGIYQFNVKVPVNGPELADPNGHNWGFFQLVDRGPTIKVLNFWDIFGHHLISIYSGTPSAWSSWTIPNDGSFVHMTGNESIDGTKAFKQPVSALVTGLYATQLADGTDCNTLTHEGLYQATSGAIVNGPDGVYTWSMIRVHNLNGANGYQELFATSTGQMFTRAWNYNFEVLNWTAWREVTAKSDFDPSLFAGRILTADDDLLTLGPGMYSTNGQTPKNMPTDNFTPGCSWIKISRLKNSNAILIDIRDIDHHHLVRSYSGGVPVWSNWTVPNVSETVRDNHDGSITVSGTKFVPADDSKVMHRNPATGEVVEKMYAPGGITLSGGHVLNISDTDGLTIDGKPLLIKAANEATAKTSSANDKLHYYYTEES